MKIRPVVFLVLLLAVAGAGWYFWHARTRQTAPAAATPAGETGAAPASPARSSSRRNGQGGAFGNQPVPVAVATVHPGDIPIALDALGTVTPRASVTVRPQLSGYLTEVNFTEGQMVKQGDFLAQIDPRPYQIALEQAQGQLARDQALLQNAQIDLARYQKLNAQDSIARQQVDTQQSLVAQYRGTIVADQAQIDTAKLDLDYCHITAPITGRVGLRQVDPGNYVTTSDANGLVIINQIQPITVIFSIPEDDIPMVQKETKAGKAMVATAYDRTGADKLATGTLTTLDNQIDTTTGTVKLRAEFDNENDALFPNQFVNITLLVRTEHAQAVVPSAAIQHGSNGDFVYLLKPDSTVAVRPVVTGVGSANDVEVVSGLAPDDRVVTDGVDLLKDGAKVEVTGAGAKQATSGGATSP